MYMYMYIISFNTCSISVPRKANMSPKQAIAPLAT